MVALAVESLSLLPEPWEDKLIVPGYQPAEADA